ncbi:MAG: DNA-directed RNA polymerase subunit omega [Spirochaetales bacterium]|nr:MAG: DNA-directed RNA polymerase subunit omega [Spirochaetales bacterium]
MILPLELLINHDGNIYELTCASIRRAVQLTLTGDEEIEKNEGKVVSLAIKQVLTKRVEYRIES